MRLLMLSLGVLPYLGCAALDAWMHEKHRRVPRVEQWLHLGIGVGIGGFLLAAFAANNAIALGLLIAGGIFMAVDELGFHKELAARERNLHAVAALALLFFVGVWTWTVLHP